MKGKERGGRVAVREGARQRGRTPGVQKVRVCGQLRKKSPFAWEARCIEGPRGWSRPCIGKACSKGPKSPGHMGLRPLAIPFKEVGEILKNVKVKCADFRPVVLIVKLVLRPDLYTEWF